MTPDDRQDHHEAERQREELRRNERRILAYNDRRRAQGLEPLSLLNHLKRLHQGPESRDLLEAIEPIRPTHRDKIALLTR